MNSRWSWYHTAVIVSAAVGTAALAWWLFREEQDAHEEVKTTEAEAKKSAEGTVTKLPANLSATTVTKEQVMQILQRVVDSQEEVRRMMREVTQSLLAEPTHGFPEVYKTISASLPADPLELAGIGMSDFDLMLERYSVDPEVRVVIEKIMGMPGAGGTTPSEGAEGEKKLTKEDVIEIHNFMLDQLKKVVAEIKKTTADDRSLDLRTLTVAAQALVSAQVMRKFGVSSEAVERAVFEHQQHLTMSMDFTRVNMEIQSTMGELVGQWHPSV